MTQISAARAAASLRHPVLVLVAVLSFAFVWASAGFASALFTNDIIVTEESYGMVSTALAGPAILLVLCLCGGAAGLWRAGH